MRAMIAIAALAATAALVVGAGSAGAAQPCWRTVINTWYDHGTVATGYAPRCYREAQGHVSDQMRIYSDLPEQLDRALQATLRATKGVKPARHVASSSGPKASGPIQRVLGELGPDRADSIPIPLMILAGFALLLIVGGATSVVMRRIHGRRPPTA
jgi:hypothetical protein